MKNKKITILDMGRCSVGQSQTFLDIYKKITVTTKSGKPVSLENLLTIASDIYQQEKLTPILLEKLIRTHAQDIFDKYDVNFDGQILKLNGVGIFDMNRLYEYSGMEKYLYQLSEKFCTQSDFEFTKGFISGMVYDPVDFKLKVKPKNRIIRWIKSLL